MRHRASAITYRPSNARIRFGKRSARFICYTRDHLIRATIRDNTLFSCPAAVRLIERLSPATRVHVAAAAINLKIKIQFFLRSAKYNKLGF